MKKSISKRCLLLMVLSYWKEVIRLCLKPDDKMMNPERNCERCERVPGTNAGVDSSGRNKESVSDRQGKL